jgi:hypothetical protein
MKHFRTDVSTGRSGHSIDHQNKVLTAGSCFADAIGARLLQYKFPVLVNPFGIIYNPISIHKALGYSIRLDAPPQQTYLEHQEVNLNYDFHSDFSSFSRDELAASISRTLQSTHDFLKHASCVLITYGTAWVYTRKTTNEIVANCHKVPAGDFTKSLLTDTAIIESFTVFYESLKAFNPEIKILLTVSPVRHIKETLQLNSVSKAVLRVACHSLSLEFKDVEYFPAYEIMMDDLRDYRFYKSDMLHPSTDAEDYIWQKFGERYFTPETVSLVNRWKDVQAALSHQAFHPTSTSHQKFLKETLRKLEDLKGKLPVDAEITSIKSQMIQ